MSYLKISPRTSARWDIEGFFCGSEIQDRTLPYMKSVEGRMKRFNFLKEIFIITFPKFDVVFKGII